VRVLVTGAAAGIGAATARRFAADGAHVVAFDAAPSSEDLTGIHAVVGDVTDAARVAEAVELAAGGEGLDVCIANAGVSLVEPYLDGTPESWGRVIAINLVGVMITLQSAAKSMVSAGKPGRLLATASIAGLHGEPGSAAYCASKAAVIGLVKTLAVELAPHGLAVNAIAPGQVDTAMNSRDLDTVARAADRAADELLREHLERRVPARRLGTPDEVAARFAFLASPEAAFVNGEVIRIDGGELAS